MNKKLTPNLKKLKDDFDFMQKKVGEVTWELATLKYGKRVVNVRLERDLLTERDNYLENIDIILDKVEREIIKENQSLRQP